MRLNIGTTQKKIYRQVLEVMRSIPPLDALRSRELDVLAMLMYYSYLYRGLDEGIKWRIIYDTETRRKMQAELEMNEDVYSNNLSLIRKAGLIDRETGKLAPFLAFTVDKGFEISFNFKIEEDV
jgi:hypothetical protein